MNRFSRFAPALGIAVFALFLGITAQPLAAQASGTVQGAVVARESNAPLAGAQVSVQGTVRRTVTNANGVYAISIEPGTYTVQVTTLGRQTARRQVSVTAGGSSTVDFSLTTTGVAIEGTEGRAMTASPVVGAAEVAPAQADPAIAMVGRDQLLVPLMKEMQQQRRLIEAQQRVIEELMRRVVVLEQKK